MDQPKIAPYGSWHSPITSELIVSEVVGLGAPRISRGSIYWLEARPSEGGRNVLVKRDFNGDIRDLTPPEFNVRSRVHEYGGGAYTLIDGVIFFVNNEDQCIYRQTASSPHPPAPLTVDSNLRYADLEMDPNRARLIAVREDHRADGEPTNTLVAIPADPEVGATEGRILTSGNDFYSSPRISPEGRWMAWLCWDHPNMPWDETTLWVAELGDDGELHNLQKAAGGDGESIFQPQWSPDGTLHFVSDRTGWWNLYRWNGHSAEPLYPMEAEFGLPQWVFGMSTYAFLDEHRILCGYTQHGLWYPALLDAGTGSLETLELGYTELQGFHAEGGQAVLVAGAPIFPTAIVRFDGQSGRCETIKEASNITLDAAYLSQPQTISFPSDNGTAHGLFYPPQNTDHQAPEDTLPPLLVKTHGGPTGSASSALNLETQYWTSRGFAVLDVNYSGSTGYGRHYRDRLKGAWGIVDVADCVNAARFLINNGQVDPERTAIRGSSAGGYTTLAALTFYDLFRAGASKYGVSDLEALAEETHKFESRYLDQLVGPYPEHRQRYRDRSPIHYTDRLAAPIIFFQGLEDKIVPPGQAEKMVEALRHKGLPVSYLAFGGEQHGFRKAETIKRVLDAELYFYGRVFGFQPSDTLQPAPIDNL